ncbi:MAG: hypothetical protein ACKPKO_64950, partial [Candidatus Fonsibacter sp.]
MDLSVFTQPSAAAAAAETSSSSNDFLPRHIIVENLIKHHRNSIEKFDNSIDSLLDQLLINRDKRNEHNKILEELLAEQAAVATAPPTAAAEPSTAAATAVVIVNDDGNDIGKFDGQIATYDNSAA